MWPIEKNKLRFSHAVVMGDLIGSQEAPSIPILHQQFNAAVDGTNSLYSDVLVSPLTITLGDEFQGLCINLEVGLQIIRELRARLLENGVPCRFVLGLVQLDTPINASRAWNMMGTGLAACRDRLEDKRDPNAYRFEVVNEPELQALIEAVGAGLTEIEVGWTGRQREIVLASRELTAASLASRLGMSVQTIYKIRRAGRFDLYEGHWQALNLMMRKLDRSSGLAVDTALISPQTPASSQTS